MHSRLRLLLALVAVLMMTACASSVPPVTALRRPLPAAALRRPLPAAALQLCQVPPMLDSAEVDDVAAALMDMYGLYGQCAGLHADLVQALEGGQ